MLKFPMLKVPDELINDAGYQRAILVRIRATGQVIEMVPDVARAMILGGTAEQVSDPNYRQPETMTVETMTVAGAETAVAPAQSASRKPISPRGRRS